MENAWSTSFSVDAGASSNAAGGSLSAGGPLSGSEKTPSITRFDPAFTAPSNRPKITLSEPTKHGEGTQAVSVELYIRLLRTSTSIYYRQSTIHTTILLSILLLSINKPYQLSIQSAIHQKN